MTKRYTGGVVSSSLPTVNAAGASGVFLLSQQADYQSRNAWPPYKIEESLRFRSSASAYLNRTPASASNRRTWTWSGWVKRGSLSSWQIVFSAWDGTGGNDTTRLDLAFEAANTISITGGVTVFRDSTQVFRDPSAWYHIVAVADTTNATAQNRLRIYVNGVEITNWGTNNTVTQNATLAFNNNASHVIGARGNSPTQYFDGYMSEINFIDGQALTPSSFGATDKDGNWSPIAYTGTYGTNGFYVNFRDNTSATTMGYDYSGNGNNWTLSGFNVSTANTTYDIMIDVPEDQAGANNRGNYCTINPLMQRVSQLPGATPSNGNLTTTHTPPSYGSYVYGSMAVSSGKWYYEMTATSVVGTSLVGIDTGGTQFNSYSGQNTYMQNGSKTINGTTTSYGATWTSGDVIGVAYDLDGGTLTFYKNGTSQGVATSGLSGTYIPHAQGEGGGVYNWNFGQRPFVYAPPDGYKTLNTFNLPEPTIKQPNRHFDVVTYTGDGNSTKSITGVNFQPGFAWVKSRSNAQINVLGDVLRGMPNRTLRSDSTDEEQTFGGGNIQSLDSNGITVSYGSVGLNTNESGYTYVAWQWNAGTANTTNTSGSITSLVRANPTAGFSVVTYTGTGGTGTTTVGHGLTVSPSMVLIKRRDAAANWGTYHTGLTSTSYYTLLNSFAAEANYGSTFISPSDSTLTIARDSSLLNTNTGTYVAYCFAPVAGYSAFGKYTGNGSTDGPFIYTGFRPKFVLLKSSSAGTDWYIYDTARNTYNLATLELNPNLSAAEQNNVYGSMDILSNGFKLRFATGEVNASGATYIYACFAEAPFKYSRSR